MSCLGAGMRAAPTCLFGCSDPNNSRQESSFVCYTACCEPSAIFCVSSGLVYCIDSIEYCLLLLRSSVQRNPDTAYRHSSFNVTFEDKTTQYGPCRANEPEVAASSYFIVKLTLRLRDMTPASIKVGRGRNIIQKTLLIKSDVYQF